MYCHPEAIAGSQKGENHMLKLGIVGVGGIRSYEDVVEFLYAGASAVQIGTSIIYEGPEIFSDIGMKLSEFLANSDFNNINIFTNYFFAEK